MTHKRYETLDANLEQELVPGLIRNPDVKTAAGVNICDESRFVADDPSIAHP